jgi:hypothetical protein
LVAKAPRSYRNATEITYADAKAAIKFARQEINFVVRFSRLGVGATSKAKAICEEFCEEVSSGIKVYSSEELKLTDYSSQFEIDDGLRIEREELKCTLNIEYFKGLFERMVQTGYCCTQVQNDKERKKCVAWFEPMSLD